MIFLPLETLQVEDKIRKLELNPMKLPFVFLMILVSCLAFLVTIDMLSGMSFPEAVNILAQSFTVVTVEEKLIVAVAVIIPFYLPLIGYFKKKRKQKQIEAGKK